MSLAHKFNRYRNLVAEFRNWASFLFFKSSSQDSFLFKMRNGFEVEVPRQMLPPFKESFFDRVYLKEFPSTSFLKGEPTVIDIGGNVGYFSLFMLSQSSGARVISFEPMPFNFVQLKKYQNSYQGYNWEIVNKAVGGSNEPLILYTSTVEGFSTMSGLFGDENRSTKIEVESIVWNQVIEKYRLNKIDLVKLDCEGSEYAIIRSMSDDQLNAIQHFSIETHLGQSDSESHDSLLVFMKEKGFKTKDQMNSDGTGYIWAWQ